MIYRRKAKNAPAGNLFLWYWVLYGIERAYVEGLRTDSLYLFDWTFMGEPSGCPRR